MAKRKATKPPAAKPPAAEKIEKASAPRRGIKVRAIETGYYGEARRRVGDVFVIDKAADFSSRWMEKVDPETPEKTTSAQKALDRETHALAQGKSAAGGHSGPDLPEGVKGVLGE